jgi:hypothetical protein
VNRANKGIVATATLILLILAHAPGPPPVYACSCGAPLATVTPKEEVEFYDAVFTGKVVSIRDDNIQGDFLTKRAVVLEVMSGWKGATKSQVVIYTGLGQGDCGVSFHMNETWLVYAEESKDGRLHTGICDLTRPLSSDRAKASLLSLGEGKAPIEKVTLASPDELSNYIFVNWFVATAILTAIFGSGMYLVVRQRRREKNPDY